MSHVIAAVSTGSQVSAIGILRLTGDGAAQVAGKVFTLNSGAALWEAPNRKLVMGTLLDKGAPLTSVLRYTPGVLTAIQERTLWKFNATAPPLFWQPA